MEKRTITIEYSIWEKLIKYRIAMRHRSFSETIAFLLKSRVKEGSQ
jgi:predicted CopG family antitoxin